MPASFLDQQVNRLAAHTCFACLHTPPSLYPLSGRKAFALKLRSPRRSLARQPRFLTTCKKFDSQLPLPKLDLLKLGDREESRKFRRTVFTHGNWVIHRRKDRYARHMLGVLTSRTVRSLAQPLFIVASISTLICVLETIREFGILPKDWPSLSVQVGEPFKLASFALSLLLVFRTDTSYARWLDARKAWDTILVRSRDFVRQGLTCFEVEADPLRAMLQRWTVAFMRTTKVQFRMDDDLREDLEGVLLPHEVEMVLQAEHKPNFVLQVMGELVRRLRPPSDATLAHLNQHLGGFAEALGTCERISSTPIPLMFTRHTSRCLVIYLTFLPLALWDQCRWATIPSSVVIAFLLLGIDEIGVQIEAPLDLLPLDTICNMGEANIAEMMGRQTQVQQLVSAVGLAPLTGLAPASQGTAKSANGAVSAH